MERFLNIFKNFKNRKNNNYDELVSCWVDLTTQEREIIFEKHVKSLRRSIKKTNKYFSEKNIYIGTNNINID